LDKLLKNPPRPAKEPGTPETFTKARQIAEAMILNGEFDPI